MKRKAVFDAGTRIRTLGPPVGGDVADQTGKAIGIVVFIAALVAWCVAVILGSGLVRTIRHG
jgi:hypothetical protein